MSASWQAVQSILSVFASQCKDILLDLSVIDQDALDPFVVNLESTENRHEPFRRLAGAVVEKLAARDEDGSVVAMQLLMLIRGTDGARILTFCASLESL